MTRFLSVFKKRKVMLPMIHVITLDQAVRNVRIASDAKADGVFLINHAIDQKSLLKIHAAVRKSFPNWWIGVNCLDLAPEEVFSRITTSVSGVWTDNALIDEHRTSQPAAERVLQAKEATAWQGLHFGGIAFKYQCPVNDVAFAAKVASQYMDVVTTSGPGTGQAADVEKIRAMKRAPGDFPLAIASGVTPENVDDYLAFADCFLVASGISRSFEELDHERVKALVEKVQGN